MRTRSFCFGVVLVLALGAAYVGSRLLSEPPIAVADQALVPEPAQAASAEPAQAAPPGGVQLGKNGSLGGRRLFPDDNPWNTDISGEPVDPNSDALIASIGAGAPLHPDFGVMWKGQLCGIPYVVVPGDQPKLPVQLRYATESDPGPYPIPPDPPSDADEHHILMVDRDNWRLYELIQAAKREDGTWRAAAGAIFDLSSNDPRPAGWTSTDAAGLAVLPGLVRCDEALDLKEIRHALRFTAQRTRQAYVPPARHFASRSTDASLPPMGMRVRLKASYDISSFPRSAQVILTALKKYGMILADNGGNWFLSGTADERWSSKEVQTLRAVKGSDFEVVRMGEMVTR